MTQNRSFRYTFTVSNLDDDTVSRLHEFNNRFCSFMVYIEKIGRVTNSPYIRGYFILSKPRYKMEVRKLLRFPRIYLESVKKFQKSSRIVDSLKNQGSCVEPKPILAPASSISVPPPSPKQLLSPLSSWLSSRPSLKLMIGHAIRSCLSS